MSVVVPAYMQAEFLPATVRSVLKQTHRNLELIVVNDASPDNTNAAMAAFSDSRLRYIVHETNQGLAAARNTGIRASRGEIVALLDADDLFHVQKLAAHVEFLSNRPDVGVSYNARFELNHSAESIREKWQPPLKVGLKEVLLGFPFSPSDMVLRREWLDRTGLFDPSVRTAEDTDLPCRLALSGCQFAGLPQALNYRRFHGGRPRRNLAGRLSDVRQVHAAVFADPRCPDDVRSLAPTALKQHLMAVVALALIQSETELAHTFLRELTALDPSVTEGQPCELMECLLREAALDDSVDHTALLQTILNQMPPELSHLSEQYDHCSAQGFLWRGVRAAIWDRTEKASEYLSAAGRMRASLNSKSVQSVCHALLLHRNEFGDEATQDVVNDLRSIWKASALPDFGRVEGSYFINRAFELYHSGRRRTVPHQVLRACWGDPALALNRGAMSIFVRSLLRPTAV